MCVCCCRLGFCPTLALLFLIAATFTEHSNASIDVNENWQSLLTEQQVRGYRLRYGANWNRTKHDTYEYSITSIAVEGGPTMDKDDPRYFKPLERVVICKDTDWD